MIGITTYTEKSESTTDVNALLVITFCIFPGVLGPQPTVNPNAPS